MDTDWWAEADDNDFDRDDFENENSEENELW